MLPGLASNITLTLFGGSGCAITRFACDLADL